MKNSKNRIFGPIVEKLVPIDAYAQAEQKLFYGPCPIFNFCINKKSQKLYFSTDFQKIGGDRFQW